MVELVNRDMLKSKIVLNRLSSEEMQERLNLTPNSYYHKLNGKRGFTEVELEILLNMFGKSIFFVDLCYDKRSIKEVEKNDDRRKGILLAKNKLHSKRR